MHSHSIRNPTCFDAICTMFRGSQPNTKQYRKCDYACYVKCILLDDKDSLRCWQFHSKYESYITLTSENMVSLYVISRRRYEQRQLKRVLLIVNGRGLERRKVSTGPRGWKTGQLVFEPVAPKQNFSLGEFAGIRQAALSLPLHRVATDWTVQGSYPGGEDIFSFPYPSPLQWVPVPVLFPANKAADACR